MGIEETWNRVEVELQDAVTCLEAVVELLPDLPTTARRSGSVGGAAIAIKERLAELARDVHKARGGAPQQADPLPSMKVPDELAPLKEVDRLRRLTLPDTLAFAHDDHRFLLPLAHFGQERGVLPKPCKVVMMDRHHDGLAPRKAETMDAIRRLRAEGITYPALIEFTRDALSSLDDDWLRAGMELGMFTDAVVFGVEEDLGENPFSFVDHLGQEHRIWTNRGLPGECFGHQGNLSDLARSYALEALWDLLDWEMRAEGFGFKQGAETVLVSLDLDAFVMPWEDFTFAWRTEVWASRFLDSSTYGTASGWSGKRFTQALLKRAGMLTIAREPKHCGEEVEMQQVFDDLNRFVFDGALGEVRP